MSRDVLAPPLQRMGANRCYRVNLVDEDFGGHPSVKHKKKEPTKQQQQQQQKGYMEEDLYADDDDADEETEGNYVIEELPSAMFKLTMHVASAFYGGIIGMKGATKRRIESDTQTDINVPRNRDEKKSKSEDITIKGPTRKSVCAARRKILLLVGSLRNRMRPTHFIGVPLCDDEVKENYNNFKKQVLEANYADIDETLFQLDDCVHLTLNVCVLLDDEERAQAVQLLEDCRQYLAELKTPFEIKISGLEIMNDDPSAVRVLYAIVDAPDLQKFANSVSQTFVQSGLSKFERDSVKLHMTIMNNRYRKKMNENAKNNFDAREILKRFNNFIFGFTKCNEIKLYAMRTGSDARGKPYKVTGSLKF